MNTSIENITLLESNFKRKDLENFKISDLVPSSEFHVETKVYEKSNNIIVVLTYEFNLHLQNKKKQKYIEYKGVYQAKYKVDTLENVKDESIDRFGSINGAAMLFPFMREDLMNKSLKSGFQPIVLPVTNFVKLYEEKLADKNQELN